MKKSGYILLFLCLAMATLSCRDPKPKEPAPKTGMEEAQKSKQESMEKYREWAGTDEKANADSILESDSTERAKKDSIKKDSIKN